MTTAPAVGCFEAPAPNGYFCPTPNLGSETLKGIEASLDGRFGGFGVSFTGSYEQATVTGITNVAGYALPPSAGNKGPCGYPGVAALRACFDYAGLYPGDANYNEVYFSGIMGNAVYYGNPMQIGLRVRRDF